MKKIEDKFLTYLIESVITTKEILIDGTPYFGTQFEGKIYVPFSKWIEVYDEGEYEEL